MAKARVPGIEGSEESLSEALTMAQNLESQIRKHQNTLEKFAKTVKITEAIEQLRSWMEEIKPEHIKAIDSYSRIMAPELAKLAAANDAKINEQLQLAARYQVKNKVTGLSNCGNTCFMNSIFQSLFHTNEINQLLQVPIAQIPFAQGINKDQSFISILAKTFGRYFQEGADSIDTKELSEARRTFFRNFTPGAQGDAQEFLNKIFEQLGHELNVAQPIHFTISDEYLGDFKFIDNYNKAGGSEYSMINRWFSGYLEISRTKDNVVQNTNFDPFNILSLKFPDDDAQLVKLDTLIQGFLSPEEIATREERKVSIKKAPRNLIVQLGRFSYQKGKSHKITTKVEYPLQINLKNDEGGEDVAYELYAIVLHSGSLSGGHYWANVKAGEKWFDANDARVNEMNAQDVIGETNQSDAYVLFYRQAQR